MTSIEWTNKTWNPIVGCSRVSRGCEHCYAEGVAHRGMSPQHRGLTVLGKKGPRWTGEVRFLRSKLHEPLSWKKPARVFVNSMSDLFHESLPDEAIDRVFAVMLLAPQHTFQILTKRPERMRAYLTAPGLYDRVLRAAEGLRGTSPPARRLDLTRIGISDPARFPAPWIWLGVSVEDQQAADARIPLLLDTPAALRWVSYEPALGPVSFGVAAARSREWVAAGLEQRAARRTDGRLVTHAASLLDWIVVGGESGPGARPFDLAWARSTVEQCRGAGVPAFVKQLGARPRRECGCETGEWQGGVRRCADCFDGTQPLTLSNRKGGDPSEWPADLRVREFPEVPDAAE